MKFFGNKIFLFLFLFLSGLLFAQIEERVVAKVGDYKIYESEFSERFNFSVHPNLLQKKDKLAAKHEFLEQLIAEKLLSLEAREKGYDTSEEFLNIINPLQNMFVRDALYQKEIKDKVEYSLDEINEGVKRIKKVLLIKFLFSTNKNEIENLYTQLNKGASFDSLLSLRPESNAQQVPKEVTFGVMEKPVEDRVYNLKLNEFTTPVQSGDGYYILKLTDIKPNTDLKNNETVLEDVKKIVETRAEYKIYLDYYRNFFTKYKINADKEVFESLVKQFVPKLSKKYSENEVNENNQDNSDKYYLSGSEVTSVYSALNSELQKKTFIKLENTPVKVKYFLNQLSHDGFYVKDTNELSIRSSLSSYIRKFIEDQLLTAEGKTKGLSNTPGSEKYLGMWKDSYLSQMLMVDMFDSIKVNEEEALSVYNQNNWNEQVEFKLVNIAEVLTSNLDVVETVLSELSKGKSISELAELYSERDSLKNKGGEFGFFPVTEHGEIGRIASQMEIGDVYGPLKTDEGYSVFQLIGKKADTTNYSKSYEEIKDDLITHLTLIKFEKFVNQYNAALAEKYGVEINEDVLKSIDNVFMNLVVVRYMGFGGEIFAVPYTQQFSGWYDLWLSKRDLAN